MLSGMKFLSLSAIVLLLAGWSGPNTVAQQQPFGWGGFQLFSPAFENGGVLPLSTILNYPSNGQNACTATGVAGGDQSPALYWSGAPDGTRSYVVMLYDVTASFTHWGMYNIRGNAHGLPVNAGAAGSPYGTQVANDFGFGNQYDGPCPPAGVAPDSHQYVFTVYALSSQLDELGSTNFPANGEALFHAIVRAEARGEVLGHASLVGFYSSTPAAN